MQTAHSEEIKNISVDLIKYTCELFIVKKKKKEYFQSIGNAVLFTQNNYYYLLSCAHVLGDQFQNHPFIFKSKNETSTIGGEYIYSSLPLSNNREDDKFDIAVVKLNNESTEDLLTKGHKFLTQSLIFSGYVADKNDLAFCFGYPANKTNVNTQAKTVDSKGLKFLTSFITHDFSKLGFNHQFHFFVKYAINNFTTANSKSKSRGPRPAGLSGGALWTLITNEHNELTPRLIGILTEYSEKHSALIATNIDLFIDFIRRKFDLTLTQ